MSSLKSIGIFKRGNVFWLRWTVAGHRYRESLQTQIENEAIERAMKWKSTPRLILSGQLAREIADYLADRKARGKMRDVTIVGRRCALRAFQKDTGCESLQDLNESVIAAWYERRKKAVALCTADLHLKMVRALCRWLLAHGRLRFNPSLSIRPETNFAPARSEFCDAQTMDRLIAAAPDDDLHFILFAGFDAGMRRNEIVQARSDWFNLDAGSVTIRETKTFIPKNGRSRTVPLTARFLAFMREHHDDKAPDSFILSPGITVWKNVQARVPINEAFNTFTAAQGVPWVHPHTMRRTFASLRVSAGVSIYKVAAWLGDRVATTERHYACLVPVDDEIEKIHRGAR